MKFTNKIKILAKNGIVFEVDSDCETVSIDLKKSNLFTRDYSTGSLTQDRELVECEVLTQSELIEKEAETIESCYYYEFEQALQEKYENVDLIISSLFNDSEIKAKRLAKEQVLNRYLTRYNCITLGNSELIAGKLYLPVR